jgi:hypothetical protein
MAQTTLGVRKYLTDNGIKDQDISYDANRKMVQVGGKDFYGSTPESDGSTYGTAEALGSALNSYRNQQRNTQLDGLVNSMTQKVSTAQPFQYKAPTTFSYNPQADPQYQAALREAQANSTTAAGNISADLNKRGIMNSTINADRSNQAAQREYSHVSNDLLPQYNQQAYSQWADQANRDYTAQKDTYNSEQDNFRNLGTVASTLNGLTQQDWQNDYQTNQANEQAKNSRINLAQWLSSNYGINAVPKDDTQVAFDQVEGKQPLNAIQQAFQQLLAESGVTGMYNGQPTMQKNAQDFGQYVDNQQLGISRQNANNSSASTGNAASNARINQLMDVWDKTGVAPAGLESLGIAAGTTLPNSSNGGVDMKAEIDGLVGSLRSGKLTPDTALQQLEEDFSFGHYTKPQYDQLKATISKLAPSYSTSPAAPTKEQQDSIPSDSKLDKMVPQGVPALDWKSWYKDPRGRSAGVPFENWQTLYGPRLLAK